MSVAAMLGGGMLATYGAWWLARCARCQNPRHRLRRRGQIGCVGGMGAVVLGLTFILTPQVWSTVVLLLWCGVTAVVWLLNEGLSRR